MKLLIWIFIALGSHAASAQSQNWSDLSKGQQSELLYDLEYLDEDELPSETIVIDLLEELEVYPQFELFMKSASARFNVEVDRESIEQSPYRSFGEEELLTFYILVDANQEILGAYAYFKQDGRDENGNEGDINWSASVRFDQEAQFFTDENGQRVDELRFEWSGH
jgi:hypothetical protein